MEEILEALDTSEFRVAKVERKPQQRRPSPPFITSSLQMEASRRLRYPSSKTMRRVAFF